MRTVKLQFVQFRPFKKLEVYLSGTLMGSVSGSLIGRLNWTFDVKFSGNLDQTFNRKINKNFDGKGECWEK